MKKLLFITIILLALPYITNAQQKIPYEKLDAISASISELQLKANGLTCNDGKEEYILSFPENNFQLLYSTGKAQRVVYKKKGDKEYLYLTENIDLTKLDVFYHVQYPGAVGVYLMSFPNGIQTQIYVNGKYKETKTENYLTFYYEQKGDSGKKLLEQLNGMLYSLGLGTKSYVRRETIEDVIDQYIEAFGGAEKIRSVKTIKAVGTTTTQGINIPTTLWAIQNKGSRMDMVIKGKINTTVMTPNGGWTLFPLQKQRKPVDSDQLTAKEGAEELDLTGDLFEYKEKGSTAKLLGKETRNGKEVYKIGHTRKSGTIVTYYIDAETFLLNEKVVNKNISGKTVEMVETSGNYRRNSDGYIYASTYHYAPMDLDVNYSSYEVNVPVEETTFNKS